MADTESEADETGDEGEEEAGANLTRKSANETNNTTCDFHLELSLSTVNQSALSSKSTLISS